MGIVINVAVVEDNAEDAAIMKNALDSYSAEGRAEFRISLFDNAIDFLEKYRPGYDVVFMDIELPHLDGMTAAKKLRAVDADVVLLFVTNMAQFAINGYEVDALDFIVKPIIYQQFKVKMDKVLGRIGCMNDRILPVKTSEGVVSVAASKLKYVEVMGHQLIFHTTHGNYESTGSLYKIESALAEVQFVRCNSCYLVNPRYVESVNKLTTVVGGDELKISYSKRKEYRMAIAAYLGGLV